MQTEQVVPRAQSTTGLLLDGGSVSDRLNPFQLHQQQQQKQQQQQLLCYSQKKQKQQIQQHRSHIKQQYTLPSLVVDMAVKQEPQDEDDRGRDSNAFSTPTEVELAQSSPGGCLNHIQVKDLSQVTESENHQKNHDNDQRAKSSRGRRKSRWKLKFHHQALPPEYLDHYEAALAQESLNAGTNNSADSSPATPTSSAPTANSTFTPITDVHTWLQRINAMKNELYSSLPHQNSSSHKISSPTVTSSKSFENNRSNRSFHNNFHSGQRPPMKYSDLPYMGEITLDNSKPRRGRKPKKADICHLIYKNYGTILPGTPGLDGKNIEMHQNKLDGHFTIPLQRSDIQSKISSLLEKRLTQEKSGLIENSKQQEKPMNLCIRDLNYLKIKLPEKINDKSMSIRIKSEGSSDTEDLDYISPICQYDDSDHGEESNNNNVNSSNNNSNSNQKNGKKSDGKHRDKAEVILNDTNGKVKKCDLANSDGNSPFDSINLWSNAANFLNPLSLQSQFLYYQKMAQEKNNNSAAEARVTPKPMHQFLESPKSTTPVSSSASTTDSSSVTQTSSIQPESPRTKRNSNSQCSGQPVKRKRSAIFIPPMPTENNNNPATEVSICKFKFTGGAKPSLQEKKSLSVDSGGNFRYYSGTGDKSARGYEFFPRESLQQPADQQTGSSAGTFLNAAAERFPPHSAQRNSTSPEDPRVRKRRTRKSVQREKLEQTFKEKGFLIQTQQLESAEGATYCKFRQLRKFTRYLFRSWKDYLPGNVTDLGENGLPVDIKDIDFDGLSTSPSSHNSMELSPPLIEDAKNAL